MTKKPDSSEKKQDSRFKPGQSGNPDGRPHGSRNKATLLLDKILLDDAADVAEAVVKAAKEGDMTAARMILDRACPVPKSRRVKLKLPNIEQAEDASVALRTVIATMARGDISLDEASTICSVIEAKRKAIETVDLANRITALETRLGER
ncbi:MAG: DUF5681 domain-containing protein [Candidatus Poribacteria bacterium]|nr:DUF5681 domain-containing protein [Candidatus Poribacteria bacterium]